MALGNTDSIGQEVRIDLNVTPQSIKESKRKIKEFYDYTKSKGGIGLDTKQIEGLSRTKKEFRELNSTYNNSADLARQNKISMQNMFSGVFPETARWKNVMKMNLNDMHQWQVSGQKFTKVSARMAWNLRMLTHGMRGFKMEMLGVMFFGMAMANMFKNLLQPAAQATGIFELWSTTLQVLFLPIMLELLPYLIKFMTVLMDLDDNVKLAIGAFALFGFAVGSLLFLIGTLSLGIGSIIIAFSDAKTAANLFRTTLSTFGTLIKGMSFVIGVAIAFSWAKDVADMMSDFETSWTTRLGTVFKGALAGALIGFTFGPGGALIGATIGLGLSLIVNLLDIAWERGWDQKLYDWVQKAKEFIKNALEGITSWWVKLKVTIATGGKGVDTKTTYDRDGVGTMTAVDDFLMRPGQSPVKMNPNDTVVGFKGDSPFGGTNITQNLTIYARDEEDIRRIVSSENDSLLRKLSRNAG